MRFNVSEKLAMTLFLIILPFAVPWIANIVVFLALLFLRAIFPALRPSSAGTRKRFWRILGVLSVAGILMTSLNAYFIREGSVVFDLRGFLLYEGGLEFGLRVMARLLVLTTALLVFFGSTPLPQLAGALHRAGLPPSVVMTFLLALAFVEQLPHRIERIFTAQEARGAPVRSHLPGRFRALLALLPPLVLSSMVESVDRGMALELRGFHRATRLTLHTGESPRFTSPMALSFLLLSGICLIWILFQWLPL